MFFDNIDKTNISQPKLYNLPEIRRCVVNSFKATGGLAVLFLVNDMQKVAGLKQINVFILILATIIAAIYLIAMVLKIVKIVKKPMI